MSWLAHPRFVPARDAILGALRRDQYRFRRLKGAAFPRGGHERPRRAHLLQHLTRRHSKWLFFDAEHVWEATTKIKPDHRTALELEARLASLADAVLLVIDSAATL